MTPDRAAAGRALQSLRAFAWLVAAAAFFLVVTGAQVTSTDSGDAVPTWPFPIPLPIPLSGGEFFELGHRQMAGIVGLLAIVLFILALRRRVAAGLPRGAFFWSAVAAVLVVVQALFGGARVLIAEGIGTPEHPLVAAIGVTHAFLGQSFLCACAAAAFRMGSGGRVGEGGAPAVERRTVRATLLAVAALLLQLVLGAVLRLTRPGPVGELVLLHVVGAVLVALAVFHLVIRVQADPGATRGLAAGAYLAAALLAAQLGLGVGAYIAVIGRAGPAAPELSWRTMLPTIHLAAGALMLVAAALLAIAARERARPAEASADIPGVRRVEIEKAMRGAAGEAVS